MITQINFENAQFSWIISRHLFGSIAGDFSPDSIRARPSGAQWLGQGVTAYRSLHLLMHCVYMNRIRYLRGSLMAVLPSSDSSTREYLLKSRHFLWLRICPGIQSRRHRWYVNSPVGSFKLLLNCCAVNNWYNVILIVHHLQKVITCH